MKKIKWGILSTATIAVEQVIPAIQQSEYGEILAIASRDSAKAKKAAYEFGIPKYYGCYDELLGDPQVEAVYIPLPNHLHVKWAIRALRAGKHVLVEKPVAMTVDEAQELIDEANRHPELKIMEAFMYKFHPQWAQVKKMLKDGVVGRLEMIQSSFSFFDDDPESIVNVKEYGGGSLMDVGCYPVSISRFLFDAEPKRVTSSLEYHPDFNVDITAAGILEFDIPGSNSNDRLNVVKKMGNSKEAKGGIGATMATNDDEVSAHFHSQDLCRHSGKRDTIDRARYLGRTIFFSSIQLMEHQEVKLFGTEGIINFEVPFNPPYNQQVSISLIKENNNEKIVFGPCNQYGLQTDAFSKAVLKNSELPVSLEDALKNMKVIQAIYKSNELGKVIDLQEEM